MGHVDAITTALPMPLAEVMNGWALKQDVLEGLKEGEQHALESKHNAARKLIARTDMDDQMVVGIEELPVEEGEVTGRYPALMPKQAGVTAASKSSKRSRDYFSDQP